MKIYEGTLFAQAVYGRSRLQIPTLVIGEPEPKLIEVPDEWIIFLGTGDVLMKPRIDVAPYVSPKGFRDNMREFKEAYIRGMAGRGQNRDDWEYYKSNVLSWYQGIREANEKKIISLKKKIRQVRILLTNFEKSL